ncbi:SDR family oxidoreductase [Rudaeicoccus suwonensis]|uniref:Uncharacterized protein YbjT (DUF2867 family) n=1 Tax=Rudaeicoccus suwonensis TaxID=657409 RepID=A0A561E937_9MICO|nr:NAD(P)H-binding protein [Rudaeicoccus suwonensis]TWE12133.1 uncharacterized protein YbjT (DUF2867 family) [Rudaeicoccus suwonensis]
MARPTDPPPLIPGLPGLTRMPVLVTGGTGTIGSQVVTELLESEVPARVLTRLPRPGSPGEQVEGDLAAGFGLAGAVEGVQAVIHCATNPAQGQQVDVDGTRLLCDALARHNPEAQLIHVSIVGCWDNPLPYYRIKCESETVVTTSGRPHTIARATQVHEFVARLVGARLGGLALGVRDLRFASCDSRWLAKGLVDLALDEHVSPDPVEFAGPEVMSVRDLSALTAHVRGKRAPRMYHLPTIGGVLRGLADGSNLPGPGAIRGGRTYAEWLATEGNSGQ